MKSDQGNLEFGLLKIWNASLGLDKEDLPDEMDEARRGDFRIDMLDEICSNDANSTTNLSSQGKDDHVSGCDWARGSELRPPCPGVSCLMF